MSRWSKNIFKEEGRFRGKDSCVRNRFKVRKFPLFVGQCGHVFAGLNCIFDSIFRVQVVKKHLQRRREIRGKRRQGFLRNFDRFKVRKFSLFCWPMRTRFRRINRIFDSIFRVQVVEKHLFESRRIRWDS